MISWRAGCSLPFNACSLFDCVDVFVLNHHMHCSVVSHLNHCVINLILKDLWWFWHKIGKLLKTFLLLLAVLNLCLARKIMLQKLRGRWIVLKGRKIPYNKPLNDSASVCLLGAGSGLVCPGRGAPMALFLCPAALPKCEGEGWL